MAASASSRSTSAVYSSPLGQLKLVATENGITNIKYLFGCSLESQTSSGGRKKECKSLQLLDEGRENAEAELHLRTCGEWLDAYFDGTLTDLASSPPPRPTLALPVRGKS